MAEQDPFEARFSAAKAESLGQVLMKAARLYHERAMAEMREEPRYAHLRPRHMQIMPHIDLDGTRVTDLAARMDMTKQGVGQIIDDFERAGLLERVPDPEDGRAKLVRITEEGRASLMFGLSVLGRVEAELAEAVGKAELTRLRGTLAKLVTFFEG